jgi:D-glutamate cyclase
MTTDDRLDRLVNIDIGGRGTDTLYDATRARLGVPLAREAAEKLAAVPEGGLVLMTTGSVSRAWISAEICENDGPAGVAVVARALALGRRIIPVVLAEKALLPVIGEVLRAAGLSIVSLEEARRTSMPGGRLAVAVLSDYPLDTEAAKAAAGPLLDGLQPALAFSSERVGRNAKGIYHNMRGHDFGMGRARIDHVFDEALRRGIPTVAVGDGGNEIGMGLVAEAVAAGVPFGDRCACGCGGGIGALTGADVLMTAACSNWGCYAITACLARILGDRQLLHTPEMEERLLLRGVEIGLINSVHGVVDPNVDGIPLSTHKAIVELVREIASVR